MVATKQQLHALIDMVDEQTTSILYEVIVRFIPSDLATAEEIEAIDEGREQFANGESFSSEEARSMLFGNV